MSGIKSRPYLNSLLLLMELKSQLLSSQSQPNGFIFLTSALSAAQRVRQAGELHICGNAPQNVPQRITVFLYGHGLESVLRYGWVIEWKPEENNRVKRKCTEKHREKDFRPLVRLVIKHRSQQPAFNYGWKRKLSKKMRFVFKVATRWQ